MSQDDTPERYAPLVDALVARGWYQWPRALSTSLCQALLAEAEQHEADGHLEPAGVGRGVIHQVNATIRRDEIKWFDGRTAAQKAYLDQMAELQTYLNRSLFLGLFEYECHFARYQPGGFYKKHLDSFRGRASRMVSVVCYLNPEWQADWGGELVIYGENAEDSGDIRAVITPEMGKLVVFMSESMPHEVLPTQHPRTSIAGWFRCNTSVTGKIDPPK
jgi:SM-20-related protein